MPEVLERVDLAALRPSEQLAGVQREDHPHRRHGPAVDRRGGDLHATALAAFVVADRQQRLDAGVLAEHAKPQADATTMSGVDPDAQPRTLYDVLVGECELRTAVLGDVAPGGTWPWVASG